MCVCVCVKGEWCPSGEGDRAVVEENTGAKADATGGVEDRKGKRENEVGVVGWLRLVLGLIDWVVGGGWLEVGSDDDRNEEMEAETERRD